MRGCLISNILTSYNSKISSLEVSISTCYQSRLFTVWGMNSPFNVSGRSGPMVGGSGNYPVCWGLYLIGPDWSVFRWYENSCVWKLKWPTEYRTSVCTCFVLSLARYNTLRSLTSCVTSVENETRPYRQLEVPSCQVAGRPFPSHAILACPVMQY